MPKMLSCLSRVDLKFFLKKEWHKDAWSMPIYTLGLIPLLNIIKLGAEEGTTKHAAFADNLSAIGKLESL